MPTTRSMDRPVATSSAAMNVPVSGICPPSRGQVASGLEAMMTDPRTAAW
ncbi:hypothetical protein LJK88_18085 [Paenibacillus sp. P26]|nr:hypothetical protein LJK88_18085 [Paenibacillus sp. P26]